MSKYQTPFQALGEQGIRDLVQTFYDTMDTDPKYADLRKMHAEDLGPVIEKLSEYLTGWMGGPPLYAKKYGTVCMTEPHENYWIGPEERDQWLACMHDAMNKNGLEEELQQMLENPLFRVADAVRNREGQRSQDPNIITSS